MVNSTTDVMDLILSIKMELKIKIHIFSIFKSIHFHKIYGVYQLESLQEMQVVIMVMLAVIQWLGYIDLIQAQKFLTEIGIE